MKDERKLRSLAVFLSFLCMLSMLYAVAQDRLLSDLEGYLARKLYYENVISQKGLSLHPAKYWKKMDE